MNSEEFSKFMDTITINSDKKQTKGSGTIESKKKNQNEQEFINKILNEEKNNNQDNQESHNQIDINILINDLGNVLKKTNETKTFNYNKLNSIDFN